MKKLSLVLAGALLFGGISFASPIVKQDSKAPVAKQAAKPIADKGTKTTPPVKGKGKGKGKGKPGPRVTKGAPAAKATK